MTNDTTSEDPITIRGEEDISHDEAKQKISDYLREHSNQQDGEGVLISDLIFELKLSPAVILPILDELEDEGKIRRGDDIA